MPGCTTDMCYVTLQHSCYGTGYYTGTWYRQ